jgi:hypothetical protein
MCEVGFGGDTCAVWNEEMRTSRKSRTCDGCGGAIRKGERYLSHSSLFNGSWSRAAMCEPCRELRAAFGAAHPRALIPNPIGLQEVLEECLEDDGDPRWVDAIEAMKARRSSREAGVSHA